MLCTMCMHGIDRRHTWRCAHGETHCRHIHKCFCEELAAAEKKAEAEERKHKEDASE